VHSYMYTYALLILCIEVHVYPRADQILLELTARLARLSRPDPNKEQ
jgi:hypothetical protein